MNCINLLDPPTDGEILLDGQSITAKGVNAAQVRRIGMVFQSFNLFGHLTVVENVMKAPVELAKVPRPEAYREAVRLLNEVGLSGQLTKYPDELSGGQKQRAAIARVLAMHPEVLLFDEPTSALDPTAVGEVEDVIRSLAKKGTTMLIVTHDMSFARSVANRVFYLDEGCIYEEGTPEEIFEHPKREKTQLFFNRMRSCTIRVLRGVTPFTEIVGQLFAFAQHCSVPGCLRSRLNGIIEEFCVETLPELLEDDSYEICIQYNSDMTAQVLVRTRAGPMTRAQKRFPQACCAATHRRSFRQRAACASRCTE